MLPYLVLWWYMSIFKKAMHVATDLLALIIIAYPLYEENLGDDSEANGRLMMHFVTGSVLLMVVLSMIALLPKILNCLVERAVNS